MRSYGMSGSTLILNADRHSFNSDAETLGSPSSKAVSSTTSGIPSEVVQIVGLILLPSGVVSRTYIFPCIQGFGQKNPRSRRLANFKIDLSYKIGEVFRLSSAESKDSAGKAALKRLHSTTGWIPRVLASCARLMLRKKAGKCSRSIVRCFENFYPQTYPQEMDFPDSLQRLAAPAENVSR